VHARAEAKKFALKATMNVTKEKAAAIAVHHTITKTMPASNVLIRPRQLPCLELLEYFASLWRF